MASLLCFSGVESSKIYSVEFGILVGKGTGEGDQ
jgi:hypothetical protein